MSFKISKIIYFSFTFKLKDKKKVPLKKKNGLERGGYRKCFDGGGRGGVGWLGWLEVFQKRGLKQERGEVKMGGVGV